MGQHFLRQPGVLDRILDHLQPSPSDIFLEIGAGHGELSGRLAVRVAKLIALEIDGACIPELRRSLSDCPSAVIERGDVLGLDLAELLTRHLEPGMRLRITGNLPYNISTAIIETLLHLSLPVRDMTFLVQLEVAQRIAAAPGSRQYGYFSVLCQHLASVYMGFKVRPGSFSPRPKVSSAVISLWPRQIGPATSRLQFDRLVKAAFAYRRKTLLNSLLRHPEIGSIGANLLAQAHIDPGCRAEELAVSEYERLVRVYEALIPPQTSRTSRHN